VQKRVALSITLIKSLQVTNKSMERMGENTVFYSLRQGIARITTSIDNLFGEVPSLKRVSKKCGVVYFLNCLRDNSKHLKNSIISKWKTLAFKCELH
jgi:hypothetical protein